MRRGFALAAARRQAGVGAGVAREATSSSPLVHAVEVSAPAGSRGKAGLAPALAEGEPWAPSGAFLRTSVPHVVRVPAPDPSGWRNVDGERIEDGRYAAFQADVASFIPKERIVTDSVRCVGPPPRLGAQGPAPRRAARGAPPPPSRGPRAAACRRARSAAGLAPRVAR